MSTDLEPYAAVEAELVDDDAAPDLGVLIEAWLTAKAKSPHTEVAYRHDLDAWLGWCATHRVHPLRARKTDVESWHREVAETPTKKTRRPPAKATVARQVSSVASFYDFLVDEDYMDAVPIRSSTRPTAPKKSTTIGLSAQETVRLRAQAAEAGPRTAAIVDVLVVEGLRVAELADLQVRSYSWNKGHRTLIVVGKGEKRRELVVSPDVAAALDGHLEQTAAKAGLAGVHELDPDQPMFLSVAGGRLTQQTVLRIVQRLAKLAKIPSWRQLSPHSLRHTCATNMLDAGVPIDRVQAQLGHENVQTTLRYDRHRGDLDRSGVGDYEKYLTKVAATMNGAAA